MYLYIITPLLGSLKNYVKYKRFNKIIFIRSFYIYILLNIIIRKNQNPWMILILERWFFFIFKIIRSLIRNDYKLNKIKYIKKYNIIYEEE